MNDQCKAFVESKDDGLTVERISGKGVGRLQGEPRIFDPSLPAPCQSANSFEILPREPRKDPMGKFFADTTRQGKKFQSPDRSKLFAIASSILYELKTDTLTRVSMNHLEELPPISGVYFAATGHGKVLYVGMTKNFTNRCELLTHHKLPKAVDKGVKFLYIASVSEDQAWHVEQLLIDNLNPELNERCDRWWV